MHLSSTWAYVGRIVCRQKGQVLLRCSPVIACEQPKKLMSIHMPTCNTWLHSSLCGRTTAKHAQLGLQCHVCRDEEPDLPCSASEATSAMAERTAVSPASHSFRTGACMRPESLGRFARISHSSGRRAASSCSYLHAFYIWWTPLRRRLSMLADHEIAVT